MERLRISFIGPANSGKSTLVNAIAGQEVSLVSEVPGTTTDAVRKLIEIPPLGPCVIIDTAGLGDGSILGPERERITRRILEETDIAVVLIPADSPEPFLSSLKMGRDEQKPGQNVPSILDNGTTGALPAVIHVMTKADLGGTPPPGLLKVSALTGEGIPELIQRIADAAPKEEPRTLTGNLVSPGDNVLLVMPQDSEAPKDRLILPQVQVLRELLDRGCLPRCCTPDTLSKALKDLKPDLVITDSQVFGFVDKTIPADCPLTSFSILLAARKGDIRAFIEGARAIDSLKPGSHVLIAEACTHVPDTEDIGRVKIPALLRKKISEKTGQAGLTVDIAAGNDFPDDLTPYSLIIQCGGCVATERLIRSRIRKALLAGVPITNYGIALAALNGILGRVSIPD